MAQIEILGLYEGTPQIAAAQAGDGYKAPVTLQAATGNEIALELAYTVNKSSSGNDTGLLISMSDVASPGTSLLADFQVGGASKVSVDNLGSVTATQIKSQHIGAPNQTIQFGSNPFGTFNSLVVIDSASNGGVRVRAGGSYSWSSATARADTAADTFLSRDAAGTLAQRNSTNAQEFRLYGTYTDASNYERVSLVTTAGDCTISTEAAGTGTRRNILLDGANRVAKITDVSSGTDTAYETAINAIIDALEAHGLAATA